RRRLHRLAYPRKERERPARARTRRSRGSRIRERPRLERSAQGSNTPPRPAFVSLNRFERLLHGSPKDAGWEFMMETVGNGPGGGVLAVQNERTHLHALALLNEQPVWKASLVPRQRRERVRGVMLRKRPAGRIEDRTLLRERRLVPG